MMSSTRHCGAACTGTERRANAGDMCKHVCSHLERRASPASSPHPGPLSPPPRRCCRRRAGSQSAAIAAAARTARPPRRRRGLPGRPQARRLCTELATVGMCSVRRNQTAASSAYIAACMRRTPHGTGPIAPANSQVIQETGSRLPFCQSKQLTWVDELSQQAAGSAALDDGAGRHADAERRHAAPQPVPRQRPAAALRRVPRRPVATRQHLLADVSLWMILCCRG